MYRHSRADIVLSGIIFLIDQTSVWSFLRRQETSARERFQRLNSSATLLLITQQGTPCHWIPAYAGMTMQTISSISDPYSAKAIFKSINNASPAYTTAYNLLRLSR